MKQCKLIGEIGDDTAQQILEHLNGWLRSDRLGKRYTKNEIVSIVTSLLKHHHIK